ncbi:hypothetical protein [Ferruginibacter sp.]
MTKTSFKILLLGLILLTGCKQQQSPEKLIARFYTNKALFDKLVTTLTNNKKLDSLFYRQPETGEADLPDIKDAYPDVYELLNKLGVTVALSSPNICKICPRWYYLKTNWPGEHPIYFIYNFTDYSRDSAENVKGFYKIDKYKNETWGLGDNWKMFSFAHVIDDVKY